MEGLGKEIDALYKARQSRLAKEKELKELKDRENEISDALLARLSEAGLNSAAGNLASISISENVVPTVKDWDAFYAFINRNKAYHLLERRPAAAAFRELLEIRKGKPIPGLEPFTRKSLNISKSSK